MLTVATFRTDDAPDGLLTQVRRMLDGAFDAFDDHDWEHALGGWHVAALDDGEPVAHAAVVARGLEVVGVRLHTGYVEGVATSPGRQGHGLGSLVMAEVESILHREFELGALSTGRQSFYERLGWERWQGPTYVRRGEQSVRTEDEDDGVMVLRFGRSAAVDLTSPIACERRPGDDW